jgi:calcineurin-like phosphoesterase family protein
MNWFTADWHMGHQNPKDVHKGVIPYCDRPFAGLTDMHATISYSLLSRLTEDDTLYVLGDCWLYWDEDTAREFMNAIPGKKILIRGNHDRWGKAKFMQSGFDEVHKYLEIIINGTKCVMIHDPVVACIKDLQSHVIINGHIHQLWKTFGRCINVGVDVWNFAPVSEEQLQDLIMEVSFEEWADYYDNADRGKYHSHRVG